MNCRHFGGYKPCKHILDGSVEDTQCGEACAKFDAATTRVLIVHLGALGAVVRSTALLPAIRRKFFGAHVTWVTDRPGDVLLKAHPLVDRVLTTDIEGLLSLEALEFDVALVVDKSLKASGVLKRARADLVYGFLADPKTGAIHPVTAAADEAWRVGLSNRVKFHVNRKTETQLMHEALELGPWRRDPYSLYLTEFEQAESLSRRRAWLERSLRTDLVIGFNTGCANTIPYKKLSIDGHVELIRRLRARMAQSQPAFVLLGGKEDTLRNQVIASRLRDLGITVIQSSTELGLRDGMMSVAACDVVVTGDSLGMHMAIGFEKEVVAWFGPTCAHEIDLYDRGERVLSSATCAPCWKRRCPKEATGSKLCYDELDLEKMADAVERSVARTQALRSVGTCGHLSP
ncbi:MAG: glycosyltransferase family 9 protein [Bdellovibrionales bacterium]|jgi:heptosyltransferase-2|nr:glycosyltransferase family 9 protein [Bdellovibrionales bacterium]